MPGRQLPYVFLLVVVMGLPLVWPDDAPFINDEPALLIMAAEANGEQRLAEVGLQGSVGLPYGPLAVWIYQGIISLTVEPAAWVWLKAGAMMFAIALGLLLLAGAAGWWKWFVPVVMLSPYLWFYTRILWDNPFLLAFSSLAAGVYAYFLALPAKAPADSLLPGMLLLFCLGLTLLMPFIHFMALPLTLALLLHMTVYARKYLRQAFIPAAALVALLIFVFAPYLRLLPDGLRNLQPHATGETSGIWQGGLFPLWGGRLLGGGGLEYFFGDRWLPDNPAYRLAAGMTYFAHLLVLLGIYLAGRRVWENRQVLCGPLPGAVPGAVRTHLALVALTSLVLQGLIGGMMRTYYHPHYYNGVWISHVILAWLAVEQLLTRKWGRPLVVAHGLALALVLLTVILLVHQRQGTRGKYFGPTIGNQLAIVRALGPDRRSDVQCTVDNFRIYPSLAALQRLCRVDGAARLAGPLLIEYAGDDARAGRVRISGAAE